MGSNGKYKLNTIYTWVKVCSAIYTWVDTYATQSEYLLHEMLSTRFKLFWGLGIILQETQVRTQASPSPHRHLACTTESFIHHLYSFVLGSIT